MDLRCNFPLIPRLIKRPKPEFWDFRNRQRNEVFPIFMMLRGLIIRFFHETGTLEYLVLSLLVEFFLPTKAGGYSICHVIIGCIDNKQSYVISAHLTSMRQMCASPVHYYAVPGTITCQDEINDYQLVAKNNNAKRQK